MTGASLAVAMIGKSLAQALLSKHAVKQVDRLLSNPRIEAVFATPEMVGPRKDIVVAGPTSTPTGTWRSSWSRPPLVWLSVLKDELPATTMRTPAPVGRGAARRRPGHHPGRLCRHQAVRLPRRPGLRHPAERQHQGQRGRRDDPAGGQGGRARKLRDATEAQCPVGVCVQAKGMKEAWCLVTSNAAAPSRQIIDLYSKRWGVEPSFRDTKDLRFGLSSARISDPQRRCCCSMPSPSSCSPCSAPPARASA